MNSRLIVCLGNKIFVFNISDFNIIYQGDTYENPNGLCDVTIGEGDMVLASLGEQVGCLRIDRLIDGCLEIPILIPAHNNAITKISLSYDGSLVATASSLGTMIRLFDTETGALLNEFRRGLFLIYCLKKGTSSAIVQSISIKKDNSALCVTSNKGTVHIYQIEEGSNRGAKYE